MKPVDEIIDDYMAFLAADLPPRLVTFDLTPIADFIVNDVPNDETKLQVAGYAATTESRADFSSNYFIVQAQLPGVDSPTYYLKALNQAAIKYDKTRIHKVGADNLDVKSSVWHQGEVADGGGSCFVVQDLTFEGDNDDCRDENNF